MKKILRIVCAILIIIVVYFSVITGIFLIFLLPLIVMWILGTDGVKFFNVSSSNEIQRTDISYFTTGDISGSIEMLFTIAILVSVIIIIMKMEKKLP